MRNYYKNKYLSVNFHRELPLTLTFICLLFSIQIHSQSTIQIDSLRVDLKNLKIKDSKLFLYGEQHNYPYTDSIAFLIFKKLISENNTNVYCIETGKSVEYLFYYYFEHKTFKTGNYEDDLRFIIPKIWIKNKITPLLSNCLNFIQ